MTEVVSVEPYKWRQGTKERWEAFTVIAKNLLEIPNAGFLETLYQRAVRTRFFELLSAFEKQEAQEKTASGIDRTFDEKTHAVAD